jgi:hypothetical protein
MVENIFKARCIKGRMGLYAQRPLQRRLEGSAGERMGLSTGVYEDTPIILFFF